MNNFICLFKDDYLIKNKTFSDSNKHFKVAFRFNFDMVEIVSTNNNTIQKKILHLHFITNNTTAIKHLIVSIKRIVQK